MVETSLTEIFSGDVTRIENMVIVPDQLAQVKTSNLMGWSVQLLCKYLVGFNLPPQAIKGLQECFPTVDFVIIMKDKGGFQIERGDLPEYFKGVFFLEYQVSFKETDLPYDNHRISGQVKEIKELRDELSKGKVGSTAWWMTGTLWARIRGLNQMVASLK